MKKGIRHIPIEAIIWTASLIYLAFISPEKQHFTLCPLKNLSLFFCPGCGLGQSISLAFHGQFIASLKAHPLGIFAIIVLCFRVATLLKTQFITTNN
ncbi:DUF2752 domain-containing protein [Fulvivirga sediminis]|uniref:DUF2752 domain-containing protein n=1 Tax=Fulvivirga sediminis TaxID=2803949 RepID=A0A937JYD4_9BACT|nr:DUF2752 domain-containing protein [Fulvivirga sediminis]MBL3656318.1 DUF2752 domain-containing protein [Fulvivirga sediminis]